MSVQTFLTQQASSLVLSDSEKASIQTSIRALNNRLNLYFGNEIKEQLLFASFTRETILPRWADEESDIDYMIVFDNSNSFKPQTYISQLKKFAETYYYQSDIHQSSPTIVLELSHIKFDLVPAVKGWLGYQIPSPPTLFQDWMSTDPNGFNQNLVEKNKNCGSLIKPLIRLMKCWNSGGDRIYESFNLEKSLIDKSYWLCNGLKEYLYSSVEGLSDWGLPRYKQEKVQSAKRIVSRTKELEQLNYISLAEDEISKLFQ